MEALHKTRIIDSFSRAEKLGSRILVSREEHVIFESYVFERPTSTDSIAQAAAEAPIHCKRIGEKCGLPMLNLSLSGNNRG